MALHLPLIYVHDLNPFAIQLWGNFGIRWYGLAYLTGFLAGYLIIRWMAQRGKTTLPVDQVGDFVFTIALGTIIGGRLGYCIFYSPDLFFRFNSSFPFWGVFAIQEGGMASHGGIIGIFTAAWLYGRRHGHDILHLADLTTLGGTLGIFFGRIANFVNGELVGRAAPPNLPWAVRFPQDILLWPSQEPQRLLDLGPVVEKLGVTSQMWQDWIKVFRFDPAAWSGVQDSLSRIVVSIQSGNSAVTQALAPLLTPRHPSQIYAALLEGLLVFIVLMLIWRRPQKPGIITATFFIAYAAVRIFDEQFRMPDAQIGFQMFGLTRGQWLSIVMIVIGLLCRIAWSRRKTALLGGWQAT